MAETVSRESQKRGTGTGSLTSTALEAEDVLAGAEEWAPIETKLVLWSFAIAAVALVIGLLIVPTSILH